MKPFKDFRSKGMQERFYLIENEFDFNGGIDRAELISHVVFAKTKEDYDYYVLQLDILKSNCKVWEETHE